MCRAGFRAFCCLVWIGWAAICQAETKALLVGVSDYDDETGIADLKGPPNDIRLLDRVLREKGVASITVLADHVDGAARPTRDAILAALSDLATGASDGDFVYIHFSGHGTRQADRNGDETDGLDEVFLAADTARADPVTGLIRNAVVDDEIGTAVDAIRAKGASVWLVMDSCYSGSGLRAASNRVASRFVDPAVLGVSLDGTPAPDRAADGVIAPESDAGIIAFYSAQSTEVAREVNLAPDGAPEAWYGLFTAKLATRLESGEDSTFRQLFQAVLSDMNDQSVPGIARLQTPLWSGGLIDAAIFGGTSTVGLRRFGVTGDMLSAGLVHGMSDGTLVGLVSDVSAAADDLIGLAQLEGTEATSAFLRLVGEDCAPRSDALCASVGPVPRDARFAQVIARPVDLTVKIAVPVNLRTGAGLETDDPIRRALNAAIADVNATQGVPLAMSDSDYQVESAWDGQALWFGQRAVIGASPVGLSWRPDGGDLAAVLDRIAKAEQLARLMGSVSAAPSLLNPSPVRIDATVQPVLVADLAAPGANVSPIRECRAAIANRVAQDTGPLSQNATLKQCDTLTFAAQGVIPGARDVNRIHIDAQFCVHASYERIEGISTTRRLGPDMTICSDCPSGYSAGEERLFVVISEAKDNSEALNLEGLVENCDLPGAGTRGADNADAAVFLEGLASRRNTRGSMGSLGISDIWVDRFNWTVLPKPEVFTRHAAR